MSYLVRFLRKQSRTACTTKRLLFIVISLCLYLISLTYSASCGEEITDGACTARAKCQWFAASTECKCKNQAPMDIIFLEDTSGSMGSAHWDLQVNFVASIIESSVGATSRVSVYKFGYSVYEVWQLDWDQTDRPAIAAAVRADRYLGGSTRISKATYEAVKEFDAISNPNARLLILLTDGNPSPSKYNPCRKLKSHPDTTLQMLKDLDVKRIIIGMGTGWTPSVISCFVDNPSEDIIEVAQWTTDAFTQILGVTEAFTCPESWDVTITELRVEALDDGVRAHDTQFLELRVNSEVKLDEYTLSLSGFVTSAAFGFVEGANTCALVLAADTYVVFYNPATTDAPECYHCECDNAVTIAEDASPPQCADATFIACGSGADAHACGECTWDSAATNTNWQQSVVDPDGGSVISSAAYADTFPGIVSGWNYEVIDYLSGTASPTNWKQTCNYTGTPGSKPIATCSVSCQTAQCTAGQDTSATCDSSQSGCICNTGAGFFPTTNPIGCTLLQPATSCIVEPQVEYAQTGDVATFSGLNIISWSAPLMVLPAATTTYQVIIKDSTATPTDLLVTADTYAEFISATPLTDVGNDVEVSVKVTYEMDGAAGSIASSVADCAFKSLSPTPSPTASPTDALVTVPSCVATIYQSSTVVAWVAPAVDPLGPAAPYTYFLAGQYDTSASGSANDIATQPSPDTTDVTLTLLPVSNPANFELGVMVVVRDALSNMDLARMSSVSTPCTIETGAPTPKPTIGPTHDPTVAPSSAPSQHPTDAPTYGQWSIDSCVVTIPGGAGEGEITVDATYTAGAETATVALQMGATTAYMTSISAAAGGNAFSKTKTVVELPSGTLGFSLTVEYTPYPNAALRITTDPVNCTAQTSTPSRAPTGMPSPSPTPMPTGHPSSVPSGSPSTQPTPAPTFARLTLASCAYAVTRAPDITLTFTEPMFASGPNEDFPQISDGFLYRFVYNNGAQTLTLSPETAGGARTITAIPIPGGVLDGTTTPATLSIVSMPDQEDFAVECQLTTFAPTRMPTTSEPSPAPTRSPVDVYLDMSADWAFNDECLAGDGYDNDAAARSGTDYGALFTQCRINEDSEQRAVVFRKTPSDWPFDISVTYQIIHVDASATTTGGPDVNAADFVPVNGDNSFQSQANTTVTFPADAETLEVVYQVTSDKRLEQADFFVVRLWSCENNASQVMSPPHFVYACNELPHHIVSSGELSWVRIQIVADPKNALTITTFGDMPTWIWYPIAAAAIAVPIIIYLIWRFKNQRKLAEIMETQKKNELVQAENMDDVGDFGELGETIAANPLATGGTFDVVTQNEVIQHQLDAEIMNFEFANVEVEQNWFKQDFGPVHAEEQHMSHGDIV